MYDQGFTLLHFVWELAIFADETPLNVLSQESRQSYIWLYGTGRDVRNAEDNTPHLVIYDYQDSRSGRCASEFLASYTDYLQVDGYAGYHSTKAQLVGCMAHARRKFEEARRTQPNNKAGKAIWALGLIQKLYRIEKACQGCSPEEIYRRRQSEARPLRGCRKRGGIFFSTISHRADFLFF
ncbi:hypothetical protein CBG25_06525 [Arsenophonus sp. ENCA]|uniref:IS66 family transposase n=1 Tax=Arsenophonus sp. ENCA TaxID=1987579 RepID=UPI000BD7212A|nr:hypothetical protein CBG25_06525 [Arsenophonus sp. ENCA]